MAIFSCFRFKRPTTDRPVIEREIVELIEILFYAIARHDKDSILEMSVSDGVSTIFEDDSIRTTRLSEFFQELLDNPCYYRILVSDTKLLIHLTQAMALVRYEAIFDNGYASFGSVSLIFMKRSGKWSVSSSTQIRGSVAISHSEAFYSALACIV